MGRITPIPEKRNDRPEWDMAGDCPAISPEGYMCTRARLHLGNHDAQGLNHDSKMNWSDSDTLPELPVTRFD